MQPSQQIIDFFRDAVHTGDPALVRTFLEEHPEALALVNAPIFHFGGRALNAAVHTWNHDLVRLLLARGADPNLRSEWENGPYAPLHSAVGGTGPVDLEMAEILIQGGAQIDLHSAAGLGALELLRQMLDAAPERVNERGPDGAAPLHLARDPETAAFLLDRGADLHQRCTDHNSTAAMWAVQGREAVTRFLVERGAEPDLFMAAALNDVGLAERVLADDPEAIRSRTRRGAFAHPPAGGDIYIWRLDFAPTPHEVARRRGHGEVHRFLLERSPPELRLEQACAAESLGTVEEILRAEPGLLAGLDDDRLHFLLRAPAPVLRLILAARPRLDVRDDELGATPLHFAAYDGDRERADLLLDAGADPYVRDPTYAATPLGWANEGRHAELVAHLAERCPPDVVDAAWLGRADRVAEILEADPSLVEGLADGKASPLRAAAFCGHADVVRVLLEHGARRDLPNPESGKTAAELARSQGHAEVAALLEE